MQTLERLQLQDALERFFDARRRDFLEIHGLQQKPALIWQCWPSDSLTLDLTSEPLREAMRAGGGPAAEDGCWWERFRISGRPTPSFEGLASRRADDAADWATALHGDGYLCAGIWTFPPTEADANSPSCGIADFYVDAFRDYAYLAGKVYEAAGHVGPVYLTCTMHQARSLPLLSSRDRRVLVPAVKQATLRWPIESVQTSRLPEVAEQMADRLIGIYGKVWRRS